MSYSPQLQQIQRRVLELRVKNYNGQRFIPGAKLDEVLPRDVIAQALLGTVPAHLSNEFIGLIAKGAKKVFAILLLLDQVRKVQRFIQFDQYGTHEMDNQLPFPLSRLIEILEDEHIADLFHEKQWEFVAPTFSGHIAQRTLENETILPYLSEDHLATGGFGSVYRIKIHPSYHPHSASGMTEFVRKELDFFDTTFENEARVLSMLQQLKHPNILVLLGCYTYRSKHNLISPLMKGGTLRQFLKQPKPPNLSLEELLFSLTGLASALWALHEFASEDSEPSMKGHHQDLRPDNILVDDFRLILADFGLSSIRDMSSSSRTPFKGRIGYCQAPECADLIRPYHEHEVTRAADIFAFGCIVMESLVYLYKGPTGVREFEKRREFRKSPLCYSSFHKGDSANESVADYLAEIATAHDSQSMGNVIQLVQQMLEISPSKRPTAAVVTAQLCSSTIVAFSEKIINRLNSLPPTFSVIIERSRFLSWLNCQHSAMFLSISGATTTNKVFESVTDLLRQIDQAVDTVSTNASLADHRVLLEVQTLITQLLNMLSVDRRTSLRSNLESILLAEFESMGSRMKTEILQSVSGSWISQMAETQRLVARVQNATLRPGKQSFRTISSSEFTKTYSGRLRTASLLRSQEDRGTSLLVESVQYQDPLTGRALLPRIQSLCTLLHSKSLPPQLRIPPFFALCDNSDAYCYDLLYEYPCVDNMERQQVAAVSLRELLTARGQATGPSLEARYSLALNVAEALAGFHDVSWFHKDLTSWNILFFPPMHARTSHSRIHQPYLFGFQHSRNVSDDLTSGPVQDKKHHRYHHPEYISAANGKFRRFIQQYDWYSLGVVLVEIGLWVTVDTAMKEHTDRRNDEFSALLIEEKIDSLSFCMGAQYAEVVKYCLTCLDETAEKHTGPLGLSISRAPLNLTFKDRVLFPLQALVSRHHRPAAQERGKKRKLVIQSQRSAHDQDQDQDQDQFKRRHV